MTGQGKEDRTGGLHWYAVYTKPRWEKKVAKNLGDKGIVSYCPLNKVVRQWSDRKKVVEEPLFKGYVFVRVDSNAKTAVKTIDGIVNFVYWNGKPAVVRDEEIETIQRFLSEFQDIEVESLDLQVNAAVVIKKGILVNYKGVVLEVLGNKAKVLIESMGV
ncbi:MAG: UpxY family transcription antiterminator, partial [Chitinophagaceae bacterium]